MCVPGLPGQAKGISAAGALLDPLNLSNQFVKPPPTAASQLPDPAAERAAAEADAAQKANAQLAANNRRRREQGSLLAKGAPQPTLGDTATGADGLSPIGGVSAPTFTNRNTVAKAASLMASGAPATGFIGGGGGGGSNSRISRAAY